MPFYLFFGEGFPTKIDYRKKMVPLFYPLYWRTLFILEGWGYPTFGVFFAENHQNKTLHFLKMGSDSEDLACCPLHSELGFPRYHSAHPGRLPRLSGARCQARASEIRRRHGGSLGRRDERLGCHVRVFKGNQMGLLCFGGNLFFVVFQETKETPNHLGFPRERLECSLQLWEGCLDFNCLE